MPVRKGRRAGEKLAWHQAEGPASHADSAGGGGQRRSQEEFMRLPKPVEGKF